MTAIVFDKVWKEYGDHVVLERIDLTIAARSFLALVGPSGCGKTTFLRLLLGEEKPTRGKILVGGKPLKAEPDADRGVVFQRYSVFPHLTVLANVMIGRFGEVVLMDWGIARTIGTADPRPDDDPVAPADDDLRVSLRASATVAGELIGTPLYMSPEQASGLGAQIDARSDLFSACVLFHEFLCLRHRFEGVRDLQALLTRVTTTEPVRGPKLIEAHPAQKENIPYEMTHFLRRGLALEPEGRWQSATAMIEELQAILDGRCRVDCPTTLLKRTTSGVAHFVDRHPGKAMLVMYGGALALLVWIVLAVIG